MFNTVLKLCDVSLCLSGVSCSDEDEKPRKRRRTNSSSSSPMLLKEVPKVATPISKTITLPARRERHIMFNTVLKLCDVSLCLSGVSCSDEDEKPRKRRRTNSSSSSPMLLKEVPKVATPISKTITLPVSGSPKMSNLMQSIANSLPPHMSPVKITFTKPSTQTTNSTTQKVRRTSFLSCHIPTILHFLPVMFIKMLIPPIMPRLLCVIMIHTRDGRYLIVCDIPGKILPTIRISLTAIITIKPSSVCDIAKGGSSAAVKVASTRLPSPKALVSSPSQILQIPRAQQQTAVQSASPKGLQASSPQSASAGAKPTIQIKQESGVKIITQQMQPSKILPKPSSAALSGSSSAPIMVVSSNGAIMTTKLVSTPTGSQATYTRPSVSPAIGARVATSPAGATYVKTTSGSIITVVPKSLATLGGKILTTNMVSGTSTKITTIPMTSKPNVIVVQKTSGKGTTIQGLPGKNVVTTLLNAGGEKTLQAVSGAKPAIITASRPITKMFVTQPKSLGAGIQPSTKIIPAKIVYGQQGKTQVLIKPKPMAFQTALVSEQTRQLVSETLQQVSRSAGSGQEGALKDDSPSYTESSSVTSDSTHDAQPVVHLITSRGQEWTEQEVSVEASPTIIYQDMTGESQSATSTIKALLELQQTSVKEKSDAKPRQHTIDLSQMSVPIPVTERRQSPEPSGQSAGDTDPVTEYIPIGKVCKAVIGGDVSASSSPSPSASAASGHATQQAELVYPYRPNTHTQLSQPPPLQAHHPAGSSKTPSSSQLQQPIITQGAAVTKITFGAHQCPPVSSSGEASVKLQPESSSSHTAPEKTSDILKISMMEAEIEPMVVDSSSDCGPLTKPPSASPLISSSKQTLGRVKSKDLDIIQVIPQYSIMPDSSQSNVVVEPSGFLEISDFTSQRLDEEAAMEQEVDSSNDEGAAASPTADQSQ
ncbi:BRCA2-interacting transcriptional repressor EMSY-like [Sinocyclocheilus rhinocerous]|uniref:BRCA2-interacting transcriptional repressor EMSY-like n=1 Tax=Sinocyclocheilus rhinocerous TaxID=307959 RepID=UPI0007B956B8|nr:PREDICTED: BRCA2-interacting transcriptional repressor EMSY-like [Sinocyclocheilus rhinocerous]